MNREAGLVGGGVAIGLALAAAAAPVIGARNKDLPLSHAICVVTKDDQIVAEGVATRNKYGDFTVTGVRRGADGKITRTTLEEISSVARAVTAAAEFCRQAGNESPESKIEDNSNRFVWLAVAGAKDWMREERLKLGAVDPQL